MSIYALAGTTDLPGSNALAALGGTDGKIKPTDTVGIAKETSVSYPVSYPTNLMQQMQGVTNFTVNTGGGGLSLPTPTTFPNPSGGGITIPIGTGGGGSSKPPDNSDLEGELLGPLGSILKDLPLFKVLSQEGLQGLISNVLLGVLAVGLIILGGYILFK